MAYSDYTFSKLQENFAIAQESCVLFAAAAINEIAPSARLEEDIKDGQLMPLYSEKAKSEALIYPIIRELKKHNPRISVFSGYTFNVEGDLSGAPDFLISAKPNLVEPQQPIFCLVESKNKAPEEGYAQCAAEMYAARLFNRRTSTAHETIYGAVTNGFEWVFLKLENDTVFVDTNRYYIIQLSKLLGIFQYIINQFL
jgi:hypothetical protein